ncbi:unnamed protein product, partial [Dovyalis caffra]
EELDRLLLDSSVDDRLWYMDSILGKFSSRVYYEFNEFLVRRLSYGQAYGTNGFYGKSLSDINRMFTPRKASSFHHRVCLRVLSDLMKFANMGYGSWVQWSLPPIGSLKLNIDGSSRNNICSGGGILRDE